jgi:hypothetical protein
VRGRNKREGGGEGGGERIEGKGAGDDMEEEQDEWGRERRKKRILRRWRG